MRKYAIIFKLPLPYRHRREGWLTDIIVSFFLSVAAGVTAHLINKWLDGKK